MPVGFPTPTINLLDCVNVKSFGATGNGTTNDSAAITAANAYAHTNQKPLYFPSGTYNMGGASYIIDVNKTNWFCDGKAVLDWTSDPSSVGYAVRIMGSGTSYTGRHKMFRTAMYGFTLLGGGQGTGYTAIGVQFFGEAANILSFCRVQDVTIQGFNTAIDYLNNVWFIALVHVCTMWGGITTPETYENFGETMVLENCFFADYTTGAVTLNHSLWRMINTSFDNMPLVVTGDAMVDLNGCHLENPGSSSTTYRYLTITGEAQVTMRGCSILHNTPLGGARTVPIFSVNINAESCGGLFMEGCRWGNFTHSTNYNTLDGYYHYVLSDGVGPISAKNCSMFAFSNYQYIALGKGGNMLANQGAEGTGGGSTSGWYKNTTWGGVATHNLSVVSTQAKTGTYSLQMDSTYTSGSEAFQSLIHREIPVCAGDVVLGGLWIKADFSGGAGHRSFAVRFYDKNGAEVTGSGANYSNSTTPSSDWAYHQAGCITPPGAVSVAMQVSLGVTSGVVKLWIDEALLNVVRNG